MLPKTVAPIAGYQDYFADPDGFIWSTKNKRPRTLRPFVKKSGHLQVALMKPGEKRGKSLHVHSLVLQSFAGDPPPGCECLHIDGNPANNRLENLRWGTRLENVRDSITHGTVARGERNGTAKLNAEAVSAIRSAYAGGGVSLLELGRQFGVSATAVQHVVTFKTWGQSA